MPAFLTHYLCGDRMLNLLEDTPVKDNILKHRSVFNLGTQGPDILFYCGAWPWVKSSGAGKTGERMHAEKTGEFFSHAIEYVINSGDYERELLSVYMCGYLCHYSLDCHTHPYIFYRTGFVREDEEYTSKYACYHRMFETALDVLMLKHVSGKKPADITPSRFIKVSRKNAYSIGRMYETVLKKVYDIEMNPEIIVSAIADMTGITAVLRDKSGLKKKLLFWLEKKQGRFPLMSSMILPQEIKDGCDYFNTAHSVWHLPWDTSVKLTSSFVEMFEASAQEARIMCKELYNCIFNKDEIGQVLELIGSRSFSTGIDCGLDTEFKYFKCIYEE